MKRASAKRLSVVSLACALVLCAIQVRGEDPPKAAPAPQELKTNVDKASYALGVNIGRHLKSSRLDGIDLTIMMRGMRDTFDGTKPALSDEELNAAITSYAAEANKKAGEASRATGEAFLAANKTKEGVQTTKSGLQYKVLKSGNGATPKLTDTVKTHYRGTFIDGKEFDSSIARGQPAEFPVNGVIGGWTEALQLMKVGDKWQLFVPSDLAYGPNGNQGIPPNSVLIFEIELLGIGADGAGGK